MDEFKRVDEARWRERCRCPRPLLGAKATARLRANLRRHGRGVVRKAWTAARRICNGLAGDELDGGVGVERLQQGRMASHVQTEDSRFAGPCIHPMSVCLYINCL